ncbi:sensor histidine kinase [Actinokineospora fastidiosa]|uniref:histidine kinase n=1 Tax=Actinokineospora fastidiosa TaxID=1816 RepID=A0A918LDI4_9PSEU|nr:HAMP domain-containing sensor histidine kinase [Actinokineospora fastidiosa]GGS32192.1 two-component sensor histidine kinase [Actinokineospora fastidiosa]
MTATDGSPAVGPPRGAAAPSTDPDRSPLSGPLPVARRRRVVPARARIMAWMLLLMAVVSLTVTVVTRNLLMQRVDAQVSAALQQEVQELQEVAESGVDRATQQPFRDVYELLYNHLQRQFPDDDEVLVGWIGPVETGEALRQNRAEPFPLADRPDVLMPILGSADTSGSAPTDAGEMRWVKAPVVHSANPGDSGAFVVGYLVDRDRAEVSETIQTLVLVSVLGLLFAGVAAWVVAGQILAPVRLVRQAAAEIGEHDLTQRIPVNGNDDIAALAEQFNAMLDRLEQAFAAQRQFVDDASHELRTPITIVRGHLELMGDDPADRAAVVRLCTDELDRMNRIVADLLVLAKAERPDFVRVEPVEVAELTSDIYAKVRAIADRRWLVEAIGEGVAHVDPQRVTQAMVQLAQNAVQHTGDGDDVLIGSSMLDGRVAFWVTDRGPGVPPGDQSKIFDRFSRGATGGASAHRSGAGLGLAIVRAIAEAHGGGVRLVSVPGQGASFGIDLPADRGGNR